MSRLVKALSSSIGTKFILAVTGLLMFGFLVGHLAGNLLLFAGDATYNRYSHKLITNPLLIPMELFLVAVLLVHVYKAVTMTLRNRRARPIAYARKEMAGAPSRKTLASSTMIYSGIFLLIFLVLHLKTFKYGPHYAVEVNGGASAAGMRDLALLAQEVFSDPLYVAFYVVAMVILGWHLRHGFASAFQSLGIDHPAVTPQILRAGTIAAAAIAGGFALIPIAIFVLR